MATRRPSSIQLAALDVPIPPPDERRLAGKAIRKVTPRSTHGQWEPAADRPDPVEVLVESSRTREQSLLPLRWERMAASPFAFLRGSAIVMAHDLATTPQSGIDTRLCGDAHVSNYGVFASPERRLVFDLNDFDEASYGPFEWDVKRLAASLMVAARGNGFDRIDARRITLDAVASYCDWMERYSKMTHLEVWYARIDVDELVDMLPTAMRSVAQRGVAKAASKDHLRAFGKLTRMVDDRLRIVDDPPLIVHPEPDAYTQLGLESAIRTYRASLSAEKQELFDRYRFVDAARKVVGVGSVGTRCWIALFQGPNRGPLFLQVKEANQDAPGIALGRKPAKHEGKRVVDGQRALQSVSDVMLGWGTSEPTGIQYFIRQLWDSKGSTDPTTLQPRGLGLLATFCGWALARAHARTGDSVTISGYTGTSDRFADTIADFAEAYADQTEADHGRLVDAIARGVLPVPEP
jgi:uncharacterized protein (DUF2252 family)